MVRKPGLFERIMRLTRKPRTEQFPGGVVIKAPSTTDATFFRETVAWNAHMGQVAPGARSAKPWTTTFWDAHLCKRGEISRDCPEMRARTDADINAMAQIWKQICQTALDNDKAQGQAVGEDSARLLGNMDWHMSLARGKTWLNTVKEIRQRLGWTNQVPENPDPGVAMGEIIGRMNEWAAVVSADEITDVLEEAEQGLAHEAIAVVASAILEHSPLIQQNPALTARLLGKTRSAGPLLRNPRMDETLFQELAAQHSSTLSELLANKATDDELDKNFGRWVNSVWNDDLYLQAFQRGWHMRDATIRGFETNAAIARREELDLLPAFKTSEDLVGQPSIRKNLDLEKITTHPGWRTSEALGVMKGKTWLKAVQSIMAACPDGSLKGLEEKLMSCGAANIMGLKPENLLFLVESQSETYRKPGRDLLLLVQDIPVTAPPRDTPRGLATP